MKNLIPLSDRPHCNAKLEAFANLLEQQTQARLAAEGMNMEIHRDNYSASIKPGAKYAKVDLGGSGKYMVVIATGEIFGIKAYGQIHRGHAFGTLDTIGDWDWSGYRGFRKN